MSKDTTETALRFHIGDAAYKGGTAEMNAEFLTDVANEINSLKFELNLSRSFLSRFYIALRDLIADGQRDWPSQLEADTTDYLNQLLDTYEARYANPEAQE